ncbi:MAG: hypothetical protein HY866_19535, partial [Chloroflexi bacterium]|nr:hypothetical protein [Chloroflexota bacterium]
TTRDILDPTKEGLYIAPEPGTPGRLLIQSGKDGEMATTLMGTTSLQTQLIPWTANNVIMVGRGGRPGILIIRLAAP